MEPALHFYIYDPASTHQLSTCQSKATRPSPPSRFQLSMHCTDNLWPRKCHQLWNSWKGQTIKSHASHSKDHVWCPCHSVPGTTYKEIGIFTLGPVEVCAQVNWLGLDTNVMAYGSTWQTQKRLTTQLITTDSGLHVNLSLWLKILATLHHAQKGMQFKCATNQSILLTLFILRFRLLRSTLIKPIWLQSIKLQERTMRNNLVW